MVNVIGHHQRGQDIGVEQCRRSSSKDLTRSDVTTAPSVTTGNPVLTLRDTSAQWP